MTTLAQTPNFDDVTSKDLVIQANQQGRVEPVYLFPIELGGETSERNTVYVPVGIKDIKDKMDNSFNNYAHEGVIDKLSIRPIYKGDSFIPSKIIYEGSHSTKEGKVNLELNIW